MSANERELVEQYLKKIIIKRQAIELYLINAGEATHKDNPETAAGHSANDIAARPIMLPWTPTIATAVKGVIHSPSQQAASRGDRDALLTAIAKARSWVSDLVDGHVASIAEIAKREGKVERHIRLLISLAFVSPKLIANIAREAAPPPGITDFAKRLVYWWSEQARGLGITKFESD